MKLSTPVSKTIDLLKAAGQEWKEDEASRLAAALAYHTAFSLTPLLVIVLAVASFFWGTEAVHRYFFSEIQGLIGQDGALFLQELLRNAAREDAGVPAMIIGTATLLLGATGAFSELRSALNRIWDVPTDALPGGIGALARSRILAFGLLLTVGFLFLVSLIISAGIAALDELMHTLLPQTHLLVGMLNVLVSFGLTTLLFALLFKFLPEVKVQWPDVWIGSAMTALLFTLGKLAIGLYLGNSSLTSTYGAAASFAIILVWIYYSAQIFFFGAELTQVYANRYGSRIGLLYGEVEPASEPSEPTDERPTARPSTPVTPSKQTDPAEMPVWLMREHKPQSAATPPAATAEQALLSGQRRADSIHPSAREPFLTMWRINGRAETAAQTSDGWKLTSIGGLLVMAGMLAGYWFGQRQEVGWVESRGESYFNS